MFFFVRSVSRLSLSFFKKSNPTTYESSMTKQSTKKQVQARSTKRRKTLLRQDYVYGMGEQATIDLLEQHTKENQSLQFKDMAKLVALDSLTSDYDSPPLSPLFVSTSTLHECTSSPTYFPTSPRYADAVSPVRSPLYCPLSPMHCPASPLHVSPMEPFTL